MNQQETLRPGFPGTTRRVEDTLGESNRNPASRHSLTLNQISSPRRRSHRSEDWSPRHRVGQENRRATSTGGRQQQARQDLKRIKDRLDRDREDLASQLTRMAGGPVPRHILQMLENDWREARDQQEVVRAAFDRCVILTEAADEA